MQDIGHWSVGLIYHKYLASKKHFDTLNDFKKGLIIRKRNYSYIFFRSGISVQVCVLMSD